MRGLLPGPRAVTPPGTSSCEAGPEAHPEAPRRSPVAPRRGVVSDSRIPEALELLRTDGWTKYTHFDGRKRCVMGALRSVHGVSSLVAVTARSWSAYDTDLKAVQAAINAQYGVNLAISTFNDTDDVTFEDVERVLEKAALERGASL